MLLSACRMPHPACRSQTTCMHPPPKTGFYSIVTQTEAERWEANREEREARAAKFRAEVVEQYRRRGLEPPPALARREGDA
jgi:hypothetical protein